MNDVATLIEYVKTTENKIKMLEYKLDVVTNQYKQRQYELLANMKFIKRVEDLIEQVPYSRNVEDYKGRLKWGLKQLQLDFEEEIEKNCCEQAYNMYKEEDI